MNITLTSTFHTNLSVSFSRIKLGYNVRKLRGARSNYCLDYSNNNSHVCGCGFPCSRTKWELPETYEVREIGECGPKGVIPGRGYIMIEIAEKDNTDAPAIY